MTTEEFIKVAKENISKNQDNIVMVWYCKTIQNHKGLFFDFKENKFCEVTYNGDNYEMYIDIYKKENKKTISFKQKEEFDWDKFKNKNNDIAVHCKTKDEAIEFCKEMYKHRITWSDGEKYTDNNYCLYNDNCRNNGIYYDSDGTFSIIKDYNIVLEFSDYAF